MTITLAEQSDFGPIYFDVTRDITDLRETPVGYKTSSMRMTSASDRVLLFKKPNWDGGVIARRGDLDISRIGRPSAGGRTGFDNNIRSVRISDFGIDLVYHVIRDANGNWAGSISSRTEMDSFLADVHSEVNFNLGPAFLSFTHIRTNIYDNRRIFNFAEKKMNWLKNSRSFSLEPAAVNIFVVNTLRRWVIGHAIKLERLRNPGIGIVSLTLDGAGLIPTRSVGRIIAHEIGHILGLGHGSAEGDRGNLMFDGPLGGNLTDRQIERIHTRISGSGAGAQFRRE